MQLDKQEILKKRAQLIAHSDDDSEKAADQNHCVIVQIGEEVFAFEQGFCYEVLAKQKITSVPCCPSYVVGIIHNRGLIIPVFDPKSLFGISSDANAINSDFLLVLRDDTFTIALTVDNILGLMAFDESELSKYNDINTGVGQRYIKGIVNGNITVIDTQMILKDESLIVDERV